MWSETLLIALKKELTDGGAQIICILIFYLLFSLILLSLFWSVKLWEAAPGPLQAVDVLLCQRSSEDFAPLVWCRACWLLVGEGAWLLLRHVLSPLKYKISLSVPVQFILSGICISSPTLFLFAVLG